MPVPTSGSNGIFCDGWPVWTLASLKVTYREILQIKLPNGSEILRFGATDLDAVTPSNETPIFRGYEVRGQPLVPTSGVSGEGRHAGSVECSALAGGVDVGKLESCLPKNSTNQTAR